MEKKTLVTETVWFKIGLKANIELTIKVESHHSCSNLSSFSIKIASGCLLAPVEHWDGGRSERGFLRSRQMHTYEYRFGIERCDFQIENTNFDFKKSLLESYFLEMWKCILYIATKIRTCFFPPQFLGISWESEFGSELYR